jgi:hypothetical protein
LQLTSTFRWRAPRALLDVLAAELRRETARTSLDAKTHAGGDARNRSLGGVLGYNKLWPAPLKARIGSLPGHCSLGKPIS